MIQKIKKVSLSGFTPTAENTSASFQSKILNSAWYGAPRSFHLKKPWFLLNNQSLAKILLQKKRKQKKINVPWSIRMENLCIFSNFKKISPSDIKISFQADL